MKYKEINRIPVEDLNDIRNDDGENDSNAIRTILKHYLVELNQILALNKKPLLKLDNITIDLDDEIDNHHTNIMSVKISCDTFRFQLEEQFNNCGILVSTRTSVSYNNIGIGTFLHAIKEDIAYVNGYSFMMYTDSITNSDTLLKPNTKIMESIGTKRIFKGYNTRSGNFIAIWMKDLTSYYNKRQNKENKKETKNLETLTELPF